jgi:RecQ family ATP-dependent DNA helicase
MYEGGGSMGSVSEEDGKQPKSLEQIADEHYKAKKYEEALRYYNEALQSNPKKASLLLGKGNCLRKQEQYDEALKAYSEAIQCDPQCAEAYNGQGLVLRFQQKIRESLIAFDKAINLVGKMQPRCYLNKMDSLIDLKEYGEALSICEYIIRNHPGSIKSVYGRKGYIFLQQRKYESALIFFDKAIQLTTDEVYLQKLLYNKGVAFYELQQYDNALEAYETLLQLNPEHTLCWEQIAHLPRENRSKKSDQYWSKGKLRLEELQYEAALIFFDLALRFDNESSLAYIDRGNIFLKLKKYEQAVESFTASIQYCAYLTEPSRLAETYKGKGHAHFRIGQFSEARQAYQNAITMGVRNAKVYRNLADIVSQSSLKKALNYYNLSLQIRPEQPAIHVKRGEIFFQQAEYEQALVAYQQSLAMDDTDAYAYLRAGDCLTLCHREKEAISFYEIALKFIENDLNSHPLWLQPTIGNVSYRPAIVQFELIYCLHKKWCNLADLIFPHTYKLLGKLYDSLFNPNALSNDKIRYYTQKLASLLQGLSTQETTAALYEIANDDLARLAHLVLVLTSHIPHNLINCIYDLLHKDFDVAQYTDLAQKLYQLLFNYDLPWQERELFHVRILIAQRSYDKAEPILSQLAQTTNPDPDVFWILNEVLLHSEHLPAQRIVVLQRFLELEPTGKRAKEAQLCIGDIYSMWEGKSIEAINAYQKALLLGASTNALNDFRCGNWDTEHIPILRAHPDYPFPVVVVLDLECDYKPEASAGSRVFEVAAVRMKGGTELDHYHAIIRRDFIDIKVAKMQAEAQDRTNVVKALQKFIGSAIVVSHNLRDFDARQLRGMQLQLKDEQLLDTLVFARLLYPDSIYHNLRILCEHLGIDASDEWHHALTDARACAALFHELGEELVRRGDTLIAGFRAFTLPNSVFDRAILQPRKIAADPNVVWELCPAPTPPHTLIHLERQPASVNMVKALHGQEDTFVEHYDSDGAYIQALSLDQRTLITVGSRSRLERLLASSRVSQDLFVLPHPQTLLCPQRMTQHIQAECDIQEKLRLFCLYQASHNHDASTLYSLRLHLDDSLISKQSALHRRSTQLLNACCGDDHDHATSCPAFVVVQQAIATSSLLIATHKNLLAWRPYTTVSADLIIVDDAEELQMNFAEYLADYIDNDHFFPTPLNALETVALQRLEEVIHTCAKRYISRSGTYERLPLQVFISALTTIGSHGEKTVLSLLKEAGPRGQNRALQLKQWCDETIQDVSFGTVIQAGWMDLQMSGKQEIEKWSIGHISLSMQAVFQQYIMEPYTRHIICGTAIALGTKGTTFLTHYFGLQKTLPLLQDESPHVELFVPDRDIVGSASFLRRRSWAVEVGNFLYQWLVTHQEQSIIVALRETSIANALTDAFKKYMENTPHDLKHQLLSSRLKWPLSKVAERIENPTHPTLTMVTPTTRRTILTTPVAVEVTGPLRFLNRRDPLVIAHMRVFKHCEEGVFHAYLLPQALLELKTRLSSPAQTHIILDGALRSKMYYEEVCSLVQSFQNKKTSQLQTPNEQEKAVRFQKTFEWHLKKAGFDDNVHVENEDLYLTLQSLWHIEEFKQYQREDGTTISQKEIISTIFADKGENDQLVVVATGGGKSLCFQLPAVLLAEDVVPRVTLVFSPLIALMRDQIQKLHKKGLFSAVVLNSELSSSERVDYLRGIKNGDYSIVYMAPEQIRSADVRASLREREIGLIAIDEAHCVSQWGHDFRTEYFALKQWIEKELCRGKKRKFPLIALTATARQAHPTNDISPEISTIQDIIERLGLYITEKQAIVTSPERPELVFRVELISLLCPRPDCKTTMRCIGNEVFCPSCSFVDTFAKDTLWQTKCDKIVELLHGLRKRWDRTDGHYQRGIIYCRTRSATEQLTNEIVKMIPTLSGKIAAYHAGMLSENLKDIYTCFINDNVENGLRIVIATSAFGMGVDAERLGFVVHFDVPATPEAYYQEAGRAGRNFKDDETAQCILLYHDRDLESQRWMTNQNKITEQDVVNVYDTLCMLRQQRQSGQELLVTEEEIALYTSVESASIDTLLYYLEYHTTLHNKQIIQREENVSHLWQVRFTADYQGRHLPQRTSSTVAYQLLTIFQEIETFHLSTEQDVKLDLNELVEYLNQQNKGTENRFELNEVKRGLIDLINAGCIMRATRGHLLWKQRCDDIDFILEHIKDEIIYLFANIQMRQAFYNGDKLRIDINELIDKHGLNAATSQIYTRFLFTLSQKSKEDGQLFALFKRDIHSLNSDCYSIQLKEPMSATTVTQKIEKIFKGLQHTFEQIRRFEAALDTFDPLCIASTYEERQRLQRHLLWLEMFNLLSYTNDPLLGQARKIKFLQIGESEQLYVDLGSLYRQEAYKEKKLSLMKNYAEMSHEERLSLFKRYFLGTLPLLEAYHIPAHLTPEQREAVQQEEKYCLVEGSAGSGKTTVLLEHIKRLLYHLHIPAERIIILTHHKSAIWNIQAMLKAQDMYDSNERLPEMLNFNAFTNRIFKNHRALLKRLDGLPYYSEEKSVKLLIENQEKSSELNWFRKKFRLQHVTSNGVEQELSQAGFLPLSRLTIFQKDLEDKASHFLDAIRCFRQAGIFPTCDPQQDEIESALSKMKQNYDAAFYYAIYVTYLKLMAEDGWYTYDDQILFALALLHNNPRLRDRYSHYKHVIIDEFQDVTPAEGKLIHLLAYQNHTIFALGDSRQAIHSTTNQSPTCMEKFEQITEREPHVIHLVDNFRAAPELQKFLDEITSKTVPESIMEAYNRRGERIVVCEHSAPSSEKAYDNKKINPALLHAMIDTVITQHRSLTSSASGNAALIVAYSDWLPECKEYLKGRYPFVSLENTLYQAPHIEHILLYLRLIANRQHNDDMKQILHLCLIPRLQSQQIQQIRSVSQEKNLSWFDILCHREYAKQLFSPKQREAIQPHLALIQDFSPSSLVDNIWQAMEKQEKSPMVSVADPSERIGEQQQIRQELQLYTVKQALEQVKQHFSFAHKQEIPQHLILTTIDNAKSQEFDTVFLLGADAIYSKERFYVGVSRAKQRLFLLVNAQKKQNYRHITPNYFDGISNNTSASEDDFISDDLFDSPFG